MHGEVPRTAGLQAPLDWEGSLRAPVTRTERRLSPCGTKPGPATKSATPGLASRSLCLPVCKAGKLNKKETSQHTYRFRTAPAHGKSDDRTFCSGAKYQTLRKRCCLGEDAGTVLLSQRAESWTFRARGPSAPFHGFYDTQCDSARGGK